MLTGDIDKLANAVGSDIGAIQRRLARTDINAVFDDVVRLRQLIAELRADVTTNPISRPATNTTSSSNQPLLNSGMSRTNGKPLTDYAHIQQSIEDILTTPLGSRIMRRDYGVNMDIIDQPANQRTMLRLYAEIIRALNKWEPRITVKQVTGYVMSSGIAVVSINTTLNQQFSFIPGQLS